VRRARGAGGAARKKPQTAEDLDKELDAFMGDVSETPTPRDSAPVVTTGDVDMA
jgi:THO complex subunit 4